MHMSGYYTSKSEWNDFVPCILEDLLSYAATATTITHCEQWTSNTYNLILCPSFDWENEFQLSTFQIFSYTSNIVMWWCGKINKLRRYTIFLNSIRAYRIHPILMDDR
jgi:hypothetical protein